LQTVVARVIFMWTSNWHLCSCRW